MAVLRPSSSMVARWLDTSRMWSLTRAIVAKAAWVTSLPSSHDEDDKDHCGPKNKWTQKGKACGKLSFIGTWDLIMGVTVLCRFFGKQRVREVRWGQ